MSSDAVTGLHRPALLRSMLQILIDRLLLGANCPRGVHKILQNASAARQNFSYRDGRADQRNRSSWPQPGA